MSTSWWETGGYPPEPKTPPAPPKQYTVQFKKVDGTLVLAAATVVVLKNEPMCMLTIAGSLLSTIGNGAFIKADFSALLADGYIFDDPGTALTTYYNFIPRYTGASSNTVRFELDITDALYLTNATGNDLSVGASLYGSITFMRAGYYMDLIDI